MKLKLRKYEHYKGK